ncbi:MAG: hypothetical protein NTZ50_05530 [Chloroflexi bacterium]|nr:hypothetical protein [Chloroflexota bacterium]
MQTRRAFLAFGISAVVASLAACAQTSPAQILPATNAPQSVSTATTSANSAQAAEPAAAPLPTTALLIVTSQATAAEQPTAAAVAKPADAVTAVKPLFIDFFAPW